MILWTFSRHSFDVFTVDSCPCIHHHCAAAAAAATHFRKLGTRWQRHLAPKCPTRSHGLTTLIRDGVPTCCERACQRNSNQNLGYFPSKNDSTRPIIVAILVYCRTNYGRSRFDKSNTVTLITKAFRGLDRKLNWHQSSVTFLRRNFKILLSSHQTNIPFCGALLSVWRLLLLSTWFPFHYIHLDSCHITISHRFPRFVQLQTFFFRS